MSDTENQPPAEGAGGPAEAWALIDAFLDGRSSTESRQQLQRWAIADRSVARMYARAVHMWCMLPRQVKRPEHPAALLAQFTSDDKGDSLTEAMILPALREVDLSTDEQDAAEERWGGRPSLQLPQQPRRRQGVPWQLWATASGAVAAAAAAVVLIVLNRPVTSRVADSKQDLTPLPTPTTLPVAVPNPNVPVVTPAPTTTAPAGPTLVTGPSTPTGPTAPTAPPGPAAVITASAGAAWDRSTPAAPGSKLEAGQAFELSKGVVELTFNRGAVAVVTAPARVRVLDGSLIELQTGSLAAHVPKPAIGFSVESPGLSVIDRGTNFGVRTDADQGASEVAVFDGSVDAAPADGAVASRIRVTAGHSVKHAVGRRSPPRDTAYDPAVYLRDIADYRVSIPVHGTGEGIAEGSPDPAWQVVAVPGERGWKAKPAVVATIDAANYAANQPRARWISVNPQMTVTTAGEYRLSTTVDLTGLDPTTVRMVAQYVAEGQVTDIYVNGSSTREHNRGPARSPLSPPRQWVLNSKAWKAGVNDLEVMLLYKPAATGKPSRAGVQIGWVTATARPVIQR